MTAIVVALLATGAVLLLFFGVFGGRRSNPIDRIEQVAAAASQARGTSQPANRRTMRSRLFSGRAATGVDRAVERRDWGANMARDLARADLQLRPSEYL